MSPLQLSSSRQHLLQMCKYERFQRQEGAKPEDAQSKFRKSSYLRSTQSHGRVLMIEFYYCRHPSLSLPLPLHFARYESARPPSFHRLPPQSPPPQNTTIHYSLLILFIIPSCLLGIFIRYPHVTTILVWAEVQTFHCSNYQPPFFRLARRRTLHRDSSNKY